MKLKIQTRKQWDAEQEAILKRNIATSELMKLTGRCLTVLRETREYLKQAGPQSIWNGSPDGVHCTSYEDLLTQINSLLNRVP